MSVQITSDEWLSELERVMRARKPDAEGLTTQELAEVWGCCTRVALLRLSLLKDRLIVGQRHIVSISGRGAVSPTYRLKPEMKRAAKRR